MIGKYTKDDKKLRYGMECMKLNKRYGNERYGMECK